MMNKLRANNFLNIIEYNNLFSLLLLENNYNIFYKR